MLFCIREMQIKTTTSNHLTPVRITIIKKRKKEKKKQVNVGEDVRENGNVCALLVGMLDGTAIMENCMGIPQKKKKIELPYDLVICF